MNYACSVLSTHLLMQSVCKADARTTDTKMSPNAPTLAQVLLT